MFFRDLNIDVALQISNKILFEKLFGNALTLLHSQFMVWGKFHCTLIRLTYFNLSSKTVKTSIYPLNIVIFNS